MNNSFGQFPNINNPQNIINYTYNYSNFTYNHNTSLNKQDNCTLCNPILPSFKYSFLIAISPLLFCAMIFTLTIIYINVCIPSIQKIKEIKNSIYYHLNTFNNPIVNNKLNKKYINKLNASNKHKIKNKTDIQCPICLEDINQKKTLVLDCGHPFCKTCIQTWIKTEISNGKRAECPMCRKNIVRLADLKILEYTTIVVDYDSDSSNVTTLSDL